MRRFGSRDRQSALHGPATGINNAGLLGAFRPDLNLLAAPSQAVATGVTEAGKRRVIAATFPADAIHQRLAHD
jgi:hypothetical protein